MNGADLHLRFKMSWQRKYFIGAELCWENRRTRLFQMMKNGWPISLFGQGVGCIRTSTR